MIDKTETFPSDIYIFADNLFPEQINYNEWFKDLRKHRI